MFCTGNMRSCAEALYLGIVQKDREERQKGMGYLILLTCFFLGVLLGVVMDRWLDVHAAWGIALLLLAATVWLWLEDGHTKKGTE